MGTNFLGTVEKSTGPFGDFSGSHRSKYEDGCF